MDVINLEVLITVFVGLNVALLATSLKLGRVNSEPMIEELPWPSLGDDEDFADERD